MYIKLQSKVECEIGTTQLQFHRPDRRVEVRFETGISEAQYREFIVRLKAGALPADDVSAFLPVGELVSLGVLTQGDTPALIAINDFHILSSYPLIDGSDPSTDDLKRLEHQAFNLRFARGVARDPQFASQVGIRRAKSAHPLDFHAPQPAFSLGEIDHFLANWHDANNALYPSAGALYPVSLAIEQADVEGPSLFRFDTSTGRVVRTAVEHPRAKGYDEALLVCKTRLWFTGHFKSSARKYGERAYRYALLECGHAAQVAIQILNFSGFSVRPFGGFCDVETASRLQLDDTELPLYVLGVTRATAQGFRRDWVLGQETRYSVLSATPIHYSVAYGGKDSGGLSIYGYGSDVSKDLAELKARAELLERLTLANLADEISNSNGLAAHTRPVLAQEAAMLELYERHAFLRVWLRQMATPALELPEGDVARLARHLANLGEIEICLRCITDPAYGVPAVAAIAFERSHGGILTASAADRSEALAAKRALLELVKALYYRIVMRKAAVFSDGVAPSPLRTPDDHEEFYARRTVPSASTSFLTASDTPRPAAEGPALLDRLRRVCLTKDLSRFSPDPRNWHVYMATSDALLPLEFGVMTPLALERATTILGTAALNAEPHPIG